MPVATRHLVFQAYGHEAILRECAFALLSFLNLHPQGIPGLSICIYTDKPAFFQRYTEVLPISFRELSEADLNRWRGAINFVHRVKIEVLLDFVQSNEGAVLYMDTDVCFLRPIEKVFEGIEAGGRYMHVQEYKLQDNSNPVIVKFNAFLRKAGQLEWSSNRQTIAPSTAMWNAGVLGFHSRDKRLLEEVLSFTDSVHPRFPKHIVEQFAFSLVFAQAGPLYATCREILHYWSLKEMRPYFASWFDYFGGRPPADQARFTELVQLHVPMQDRGSFYLNRSPLEKIQRRPWIPLIPDWAELEQQMPA